MSESWEPLCAEIKQIVFTTIGGKSHGFHGGMRESVIEIKSND